MSAPTRRSVLRGVAGVFGIAAATFATACAEAAPEPVPSDENADPAVTVRVADNVFEPAEVEIAPGEAVRWEFTGSMEHDVVADDGSFVSELMSEGSYTHVFEEAGEFPYTCSVHPEMLGAVRVAS